MTIWEVKGELVTDSGTGGPETWFYITPNALTLPSIDKRIFTLGSSNGREWYRIDSIRAVGEFPDTWHEEDLPTVMQQLLQGNLAVSL